MGLLLPGNLGAAESVSLPGGDPGPVLWWDTTSLTWTVKDSALQETPGEQLWKHQSSGGRGIRKVLIANETGDFRMFLSNRKIMSRK